jgi:hypothetical protein
MNDARLTRSVTCFSIDPLVRVFLIFERIGSDVPIRLGGRIELVLDTAKVHFFDPATGSRVGDR